MGKCRSNAEVWTSPETEPLGYTDVCENRREGYWRRKRQTKCYHLVAFVVKYVRVAIMRTPTKLAFGLRVADCVDIAPIFAVVKARVFHSKYKLTRAQTQRRATTSGLQTVDVATREEEVRVVETAFVAFNMEQTIATCSCIARQGDAFEPGVHDVDRVSSMGDEVVEETPLATVARNKVPVTVHLHK